ncbi:hypothetical protein APR50_10465 [Variovorax paradoxus]|uniref:transglycosylase SLT domain-containing protein n=1 Tax=Variovorax paradoxus TaxID=34073 RepID=UPI0006E6A4F6|nr:hypothetical protein APR52_20715 [Variovorax paradoxus]KPV08886.1 hypothetical protein APR50_10465 [Variovorax paradoxus]KPV11383.1 hypothetical protein APR49_09340 [Variovorax paradoxus]KPV23275.1 hypothetical protein APR51_07915 [Variovorax paradoxus]KPV31159.1 hypothetical protein APR48_17690 [Variovorax paradoxus]
MATVPRVTQRSVAPAGAPNITLQNSQSAGLLSIGARQSQAAGAALGQAGEVLERARYEAIEQANALRVDDALNQATEAALRLQSDPKDGYSSIKGYDALNRQSGMPLAEEYAGKLDKTFSEIASGLGNDRQRAMFTARANNVRTQFYGQAMKYEGEQQQSYTLSVREASVKNAANALVLNFSDPENVKQQETRIRAAIEGGVDPDSGVFVPGAAQMQGKAASWAREKSAEAISGAHLGAIKSALDAGNVNAAMAYRKRYGDRLTASDMLQIDGTLQRDYDTRVGAAVATQIVQGTQSTVNPSSMDRLTNIVMGLESRGRDTDAAGNVLTSPRGAKGRMQVMDGTNRDPGFGVRPAANDSLEERARVGRDYLGAMVKRYDGDVAKAAAAYNWGPGAVDDAIKAAEKNAGKGERVAPDAWLASAPAETRTYVANVVQQLTTPSGGVAPRPTQEQLHQAVRERLGPNASPVALKTALDTVTQQFEDQSKAIAQRKDEIVTAAMQELVKNGGRYTELPAGTRASLARFAPDKVDEVMNFGKRLALGDDTTDDRIYLRLTTNPQALTQMTDAQFYQLRNGLSKEDFQRFSQKRADLLAGVGTNAPGDLNDGAISRVANQRLASLGIDPTPKDGSADAQRVGAIRRFIDSSVIDAQRAAGKKFSDAEVQAHIDGLFAKNVTFRRSFLGFDTGTGGQQMLSMKVGDIPSAQADAIKKAFKARGNDNPTDADILGAYWASKSAQAPRDARTGSF